MKKVLIYLFPNQSQPKDVHVCVCVYTVHIVYVERLYTLHC